MASKKRRKKMRRRFRGIGKIVGMAAGVALLGPAALGLAAKGIGAVGGLAGKIPVLGGVGQSLARTVGVGPGVPLPPEQEASAPGFFPAPAFPGAVQPFYQPGVQAPAKGILQNPAVLIVLGIVVLAFVIKK